MTSNGGNNYGSLSKQEEHGKKVARSYQGISVKQASDNETTPLLSEDKDLNVTLDPCKRSWISRLTFTWVAPILHFGNTKNKLDESDLNMSPLPKDCTTPVVMGIFDEKWEDELKRADKKPSLARALWRSYSGEFLQAGVLKLGNDSLTFVGPVVLNAMIYYLRDASATYGRGLYLTGMVALSQLGMSLCLRHYFFKCYKTGLRLRTAVVMAVYKKALVLDSGERQTRTAGEITNLMSIDAKRLQDVTSYLHGIWYSVFQISVAIYFLWQLLGPCCTAGIVVMVFAMPVAKWVAKGVAKRQKRVMKARDARVNINSEVLGSMKTVKIQAWEEAFENRIMGFRVKELRELLQYWIFSSSTAMIWNATPLAVALSTFAAYVWLGNDLEVASALTALVLFDILRFPMFLFPMVINNIAEAFVSIDRVQSFLLCDEQHPISSGGLEDPLRIKMTNFSSAYDTKKPRVDDEELRKNPGAKQLAEKDWEVQLLKARLEVAEQEIKVLTRTVSSQLDLADAAKDGKQVEVDKNAIEGSEDMTKTKLLCLKRVNFQCQQGELIAVVGTVGSGKSSFVNSILGEVRQLAGTAAVSGKLAYFSQNAFILNASVRDNILFGHVNEKIDEEKYKRAIYVCALTHDLDLLPAGDRTEIGEKGVTLSGGQKARVALARLVYHSPDIALIDDALAAVDAHVAKHLFEKCVVEELIKNQKCSVILVTNAIQYLNNESVSRIVVVNDGMIIEEGSYWELCQDKKSMLAKLVAVVNETGIGPEELDGEMLDTSESPRDSVVAVQERLSITTKKRRSSSTSNKEADGRKVRSDQLMTEESRSFGHVKLEVYLSYARSAGGLWVPVLVTCLFASVSFINVGAKWWLTYWSSHGNSSNQYWFLTIYALINLASVVAAFLSYLSAVVFGLRASRKLFNQLLVVMLHAPMSFFDTTPIGRIVNRFSKDMYTIDEEIVMTARSYLSTLMAVISTIVVISGVTPIFTACLIPIILFYMKQQQFFTVTYRELKRIDSVNRSPLYALLGETIDGVATIRAFAAQKALVQRLTSSLDTQQHAYFLTCAALSWLAVRLELIGTSIIAFACLCSVIQHHNINGDEVLAGIYGLSISYALGITQSLNWSVRMASDFEANMVAVERVDEYLATESEADRHTKSDDLAGEQGWPSDGQLSFVGAKLRYRSNLPLVLKGLDIDIPGGSKVGVVGRTGAGKSTLMTAILRIVELDSGMIIIDGIEIRSLGLALLRKSVAVIPQDPVLFSGTIRTNLDPFHEYQDYQLESVLDRVGLLKLGQSAHGSVSSGDSLGHLESLDDIVNEGGINLSVGQRQLLVIARALLCSAKLVILDEATAAVDADTDAFIQRVLRTEFMEATTITVAHRINTIMDSDFILVMSDGRAAEFDTPKALLSKGGMFRDLVQAATLEKGKLL